MRILSNCCLWSKPDIYSGVGRPKKHDQKFKVNDPTTWWQANEIVEVDDSKLGKLKISKWDNLHFRSSPAHDMSLIQVERLNQKSSGKKRRPLWLVWVGEQFLELKDIWSQYARRFERKKCVGFARLFHFAVGVDHWYRFAKQRLHWTLPLTFPVKCIGQAASLRKGRVILTNHARELGFQWESYDGVRDSPPNKQQLLLPNLQLKCQEVFG